MARLTKAQEQCPYCWNGETDFGDVELPDGSQIVFSILTTAVPTISALVFSKDENGEPLEQECSIDIEYCPFCGRKLEG